MQKELDDSGSASESEGNTNSKVTRGEVRKNQHGKLAPQLIDQHWNEKQLRSMWG